MLGPQNHAADLLLQLYASELPDAECATHPSVFSCSHMIHAKCFEELMQTVGNVAMRKQGTFFCPVCRRLGSSVFPLFFPVKVDCQWRERLGDALLFRPDAVDDRSFDAMYAEEKEAMDHYLLVVVGRSAEE